MICGNHTKSSLHNFFRELFSKCRMVLRNVDGCAPKNCSVFRQISTTLHRYYRPGVTKLFLSGVREKYLRLEGLHALCCTTQLCPYSQGQYVNTWLWWCSNKSSHWVVFGLGVIDWTPAVASPRAPLYISVLNCTLRLWEALQKWNLSANFQPAFPNLLAYGTLSSCHPMGWSCTNYPFTKQ